MQKIFLDESGETIYMVKKLSFVLQDFHINIQDLQEVYLTKVLRKSRISFLFIF